MKTSIYTTLFLVALCPCALAQVAIVDTQRYIDANTFVLNEPCLNFGGTQYKGEFMLEQSTAGLTWKILSGEALTESRKGCTQILAGINEDEFLFNLKNLVVADGNADTGQRYDVDSIADTTRLDLGFSLTTADQNAVTYWKRTGLVWTH